MHQHGDHQHAAARIAHDRRRLSLTLALITAYMAAEAIGGWLANSLALLADAGHMLSDAAALGLSLFALWIAQRPPDAQRSYGYHRAEILAALVNGSTLVAVSLVIFLEAARRAAEPPEVQGLLMTGRRRWGPGREPRRAGDPARQPCVQPERARALAAHRLRYAGERGGHRQRRADLVLRAGAGSIRWPAC